MISDDVKFVRYHATEAQRFGHWVLFKDYRSGRTSRGRAGRKDLIKFFESSLGPLGERWQYQKDENYYILKMHNEADVVMFLLRYNKG